MALLLVRLTSVLLLSATTFGLSPWSPASWRIMLNVGRESSTTGTSGARLVLPIDIRVESSEATATREEEDAEYRGGMRLVPISDSTYINAQGEQTVSITEGGWKITLPRGKQGHAASLRFYLDVKNEATRNDVALPAERIYFTANCWRLEELERGRCAMEPIWQNYRQAQELLERRLSHESGDRRLDGTEPLETVLAYKDMAQLVRDRNAKRQAFKEAEQILPKNADSLPLGPWPGATEPLAVAPGTLFVKRKTLFTTEHHAIGTWQATPILVSADKEDDDT